MRGVKSKKLSWPLRSPPQLTPATGENSPINVRENVEDLHAFDSPTEDSSGGFNTTIREGECNTLCLIKNPMALLQLNKEDVGKGVRLPTYFYNALIVEIRDMFRMLHGMEQLSDESRLEVNHVTIFYEWFEGFFGMITCLFDTEEDILFSWVEKICSTKMKSGLSSKRRKTKKQRMKDLCFDIFDLKIQFSRSQRHIDLGDFLKELLEEVEHLALRVLSYVTLCKNQVPSIIRSSFNDDEACMVDTSFFGNLRASDPGKFLICAFARCIPAEADKCAFLEEAFKPGKITKRSGQSYDRKYHKQHCSLAEGLASHPLLMETSQ